ncbi:MAG: hypothetical protein LBG80_09335 [Bacteroidales bacterium]|jgi:hypothetical protein|nr:hypothetical protein [Bacteroidales bacterium]
MKNILKIKVLVTIAIFVAGCFMTGCQKEYNNDSHDILDDSSLEIEEYIIAGLDYQHALNTFSNEIKNIDFSKISRSQDSKGNIVVHISTSVCIEEKVRTFNEKKKLLLDKCPQIVSFSSKVRSDYFQQRMRNSAIINEKALELGININKPRLKNWSYESYSDNSYIAYLDSQLSSSNYVEIVLIVFENGTAMTYIDSRNTSSECWYPTLYKQNNKWYVVLNNSSPIDYIAHTHRYSNTPSAQDLASSWSYPGLDERIYTSGGNTTAY